MARASMSPGVSSGSGTGISIPALMSVMTAWGA
jgi:hypothetical protein